MLKLGNLTFLWLLFNRKRSNNIALKESMKNKRSAEVRLHEISLIKARPGRHRASGRLGNDQ